MIKKNLFYLCFSVSLIFGKSLPLKVGETLLYNASFRGIQAASASLKTIKKEVIGTDSVYHVRFRAKSKGPINYIFPIDDEINLWIDIKTFLPIKIHEKISEGKFKRSTTIHFNRTSKFALINTDTLQIGNTDILIQKDGFIPVNEYQQTNLENIYAIGDIVGNPMLAHKATHQGKVAAEVCAGVPSAFDVEAIPSVVYTDPEVAWVGVTELYAKEKNIPFKKGEFPWVASGRATAVGSTYGKTKILFSPDNNKVIGVGIVGVGAGDLISEAALAIEMGATPEDLALTIHAHPTLSETFANAAEIINGTITDLYMPKK